MRMSHFLGKQLKEDPKDAQMVSHKFLIRGGYIRQLSTGIYSFLPLGFRVKMKIEEIIREEMNAVGGQEVVMPVVHPADIWKETGRFDAIDESLLRFKDRSDKDHVLAMTHEEAAVHLVRNDVNSYKQLPFMIYQIQTKFRDEARSRGGLIRVREFTMKDAYSFHPDSVCLEKFYAVMHEAYMRIFKRSGLKNFISVQSDSGIMGGGVSHEFMSINPAGEDTLFLCECGYNANREIAEGRLPGESAKTALPLEEIATPGKKTIEDVCDFLKITPEKTAKCVFYTSEKGMVLVVIRGDREVNETRLKAHLQIEKLSYADDAAIRDCGAVPGYASPMGLDSDKLSIVLDISAAEGSYVCGANKENAHMKHFTPSRDMKDIPHTKASVYTTIEGDLCPECGKPLSMARGIEIGNIFQLGTKYSAPMKALFLDEKGESREMIMASYGIGVGRLMATVIEDNHDDYGPIWPAAVAPFTVHLNALNLKEEEVRKTAESLYDAFIREGIDVLYDDRDERPGSQFSDADLIGAPLRVIVSKRNLEKGEVEIKQRGEKTSMTVPAEETVSKVKGLLAKLLASWEI
jgi:prolyl-tRNA synthetase